MPHASSVEVLIDGEAVPMEKKHAHGFFCAHFDREPLDYRFRVHLWGGAVEIVDDPYRFPPLLTDFDLYLHGEGTHYESYRHARRARCRSRRASPACGSPSGRRTRRSSR